MKNYKALLILGAVLTSTACSKDDEDQAVVKLPSAKFEVENINVVSIPDSGANNVPGVAAESNLTVSSEGTIADGSKVTVTLDLTHSFCSDLVVRIFGPSGDFTLLKRPLSGTEMTGSNFVAGNLVSFNGAAASPLIAVDTNIPAGTYLPTDGSNPNPTTLQIGDLSEYFQGKSIKGNWKIQVVDYVPGDVGTINNCKITFDTGALQ